MKAYRKDSLSAGARTRKDAGVVPDIEKALNNMGAGVLDAFTWRDSDGETYSFRRSMDGTVSVISSGNSGVSNYNSAYEAWSNDFRDIDRGLPYDDNPEYFDAKRTDGHNLKNGDTFELNGNYYEVRNGDGERDITAYEIAGDGAGGRRMDNENDNEIVTSISSEYDIHFTVNGDILNTKVIMNTGNVIYDENKKIDLSKSKHEQKKETIFNEIVPYMSRFVMGDYSFSNNSPMNNINI